MNKGLVAGHKGFSVKKRPREYRVTEPQEIMRQVVKECGIKKGISKVELQKAMIECVGPTMKEYYLRKVSR